VTAPATLEQRQALAESEHRDVRRTFSGVTCEKREADGKTLRSLKGYASVFGVEYDMGWYVEEVAPTACDKTLREKPDVVLLVNHDGLPLARTRAGDLDLSADGTGLLTEAPRLDPDDPDVARLAFKMDRGLLDEMSFAFRIVRQEWNQDYTKRYITELSLHKGDVSVVNYGANDKTSSSMRGLELLARLDELSPTEQRAAYERLAVLLDPSTGADEAAERAATDAAGISDELLARDADLALTLTALAPR
jgi:HK97 family phage prohead protease